MTLHKLEKRDPTTDTSLGFCRSGLSPVGPVARLLVVTGTGYGVHEAIYWNLKRVAALNAQINGAVALKMQLLTLWAGPVDRQYTEEEVGCCSKERFVLELEFVQCLASPQYIYCENLATHLNALCLCPCPLCDCCMLLLLRSLHCTEYKRGAFSNYRLCSAISKPCTT